MEWRKSSFSGSGGDCVEVSWRKSSFSGDGGDCVEVRHDLAAIRDSKNAPGPTLTIDLAPLLAAVRSGRLDS